MDLCEGVERGHRVLGVGQDAGGGPAARGHPEADPEEGQRPGETEEGGRTQETQETSYLLRRDQGVPQGLPSS